MPGEHLGELLSAQLDGELTDEQSVEMQGHLAVCAECRAELESTSAVRAAVRDAPAVDAPFGFYERMLRDAPRSQPARGWRAGVAVLGVAAAWVVIIGLIADPRAAKEAPAVDAVRAALASPALQHGATTVGHTSAGDVTFTPATSGGDVALPDQINGLRRGRAFTTTGGGTLVVFGDSPKSWIGVQTKPGKVDWSTLTGGLRHPVAGVPGDPWRSTDPAAMAAIVYESNGVGVTVAGPVDQSTLDAVARQLPLAGDPSVLDRLAEGLRTLVDGW
jgi:anti-sigma factor RsiW